jgi:nicotinate-nucleotide--dimethylbenzimidazole phosphoribosyltransferase
LAAYPQAVTQQMMANFLAGGAAISVLAREAGAHLEVVDAGTLAPAPLPGVVWDSAGQGTTNFTRALAMTAAQLDHTLGAGQRAVARAKSAGADLFIGGEMGIGNTTSAAALGCALLGLRGVDLAGPGTGLNAEGVARKAAVIDRGLALHGFLPPPPGEGRGEGTTLNEATAAPSSPSLLPAEEGGHALRTLGGFEIAALAGAYIAAAQAGIPVLVDGFITTAAALAACRLHPGTRDWLLFAHAGAEPGHARLLAALEARPLLHLNLRLGEGSGAALALPLLRQACALHNGMATFAEAQVSEH